MTMTLEQVRDWHRSNETGKFGWLHRDAADAIDAHLAQPAQSVDVGAIREVIGDLREWGKTDEQLAKRAEWLTAALQEPDRG